MIGQELATLGVENVLPLRGDPPRGTTKFEPVPGGFSHANELIEFIRTRRDFCLGGACYPETHPEASDADTDLGNLVRKVDAGVDFLITQLFFENPLFFSFEQRAREAGIRVPIMAGIMPVTNLQQIERFTKICGASIPQPLRERLVDVESDPQEVFWTGVSYAAHQCRGLLQPGPNRSGGASGIHFYTLNKSPATRAIFEILQLARSTPM